MGKNENEKHMNAKKKSEASNKNIRLCIAKIESITKRAIIFFCLTSYSLTKLSFEKKKMNELLWE